ncbi:phosphodiesterase [Ramlibacter sp. H39-3-26]|uniref:HD-GYP domain-containing protein n=1 Tax=Curvibacter soli TaxID=3031331 RepID=UPI0023DA7E48|nr:phosphodiesterase [Ramlibacter sp. H39-3-26]MDF1485263.1 phosphodiesterase [Ramlibacter sp. H39-3-26]
MLPAPPINTYDSSYEDLQSQWTDLELGLSMLLAHPRQAQEFPRKVRQFDRWMQDLVTHDTDAALYLLFQLALTSSVGYSASHALVCAALCHIVAPQLGMTGAVRDSLVRAAITMNIGMTELQDVLAEQRERPSSAQQEAIRSHPQRGRLMLEQFGIADGLWLDTVAQHHAAQSGKPVYDALPQAQRPAYVLGLIDRYAAMISPRKSRPGRSATDTVRMIVGDELQPRDPVGIALVRSVGLCPPGTFVRLDNGDTAVVLRRSSQANQPLVASLLDSHAEPYEQPRLHHTSDGKPHIQSALSQVALRVELNHRTMVRLGLYVSQGRASLEG